MIASLLPALAVSAFALGPAEVRRSSAPVGAEAGNGVQGPVSRDFPSAGLKEVEVRASAGIVVVARADTDKVSVQVTPKRATKACGVTVEERGDKVVVYAREKRKSYYSLSLGKDSCEADIVIRMPQHLALDAATGSGSLGASGLGAAIRLRSGSGSLALKGCTGPLEARMGSGRAEAEGLRQGARVKTGSGAVRLAFAAAPEDGEIRVETGSGSVSISLPPATKASFSLRAGSGRIQNTFQDAPTSALEVTARTGSGDILILGGP